MSEQLWWRRLADHFEAVNGFPLPIVMQPQAEREIQRLSPGTLLQAVGKIIDNAALNQSLVDALGMGLTWFNRESQGIDGLVESFRLQYKTTGRSTVWLWSAGCSMGQEPYSLAIALIEAGGRPVILATDLNREHLRIARQGRYRTEKLKMIPLILRDRYFTKVASDLWEVTPLLQRSVSFELHNFATSNRPPVGWDNFDMVVCRNALIYYDALEGARIAGGLAQSLRPGGVMLIGAVERPLLRHLDVGEISEAGLATFGVGPSLQEEPLEELPTPPERPNQPVLTPPPAPAPAPSADIETLLSRADQLARDHREPESIAVITEAVKCYPLSANAHLMLGFGLKRQGKVQEAIDALRAASFLDSKGWLAAYQLGLCLESEGQQDDSKLAFRDALSLIEAGHPAASSLIPGMGDLKALASTVAESCQSRLSLTKNESSL